MASPGTKREGDDTEAINRLFAPEFRNRLDAVISFSHLPKTVVARVVDKFVLQLEAQLADRNVTIELSDEAREWLVENGYDEAMGARPMARLIQQTIKTPLADEVLFGRLKGGGAVKVVVVQSESGIKVLGLEFPEGPVKPRPGEGCRGRRREAQAQAAGQGRRDTKAVSSTPRRSPRLAAVDGKGGKAGNGRPSRRKASGRCRRFR